MIFFSILAVKENQLQELLFIWYSITQVARYGNIVCVFDTKSLEFNLFFLFVVLMRLCAWEIYKFSYPVLFIVQ